MQKAWRKPSRCFESTCGEVDTGVKVLAISCSPRDGATEHAARLALRYLEGLIDADTRLLSSRGRHVAPCIHCDRCVRTKNGCAFSDGMDEIYEGLAWADAILLGTPVYNGTLSAQAKAVMDRTRAVVAAGKHALDGKIGIALAVGGDRNGGQELAMQAINTFFLMNFMIPACGGAFTGNCGIAFWSKDLGAGGIDSDEEGLRAMRAVVKRAIELVRRARGEG